jgi:hypothetical protein
VVPPATAMSHRGGYNNRNVTEMSETRGNWCHIARYDHIRLRNFR